MIGYISRICCSTPHVAVNNKHIIVFWCHDLNSEAVASCNLFLLEGGEAQRSNSLPEEQMLKDLRWIFFDFFTLILYHCCFKKYQSYPSWGSTGTPRSPGNWSKGSSRRTGYHCCCTSRDLFTGWTDVQEEYFTARSSCCNYSRRWRDDGHISESGW